MPEMIDVEGMPDGYVVLREPDVPEETGRVFWRVVDEQGQGVVLLEHGRWASLPSAVGGVMAWSDAEAIVALVRHLGREAARG